MVEGCVAAASNQMAGLEKLQEGEQKAILLAESAQAEIVLLDEKAARRGRHRPWPRVTGTLGVPGGGNVLDFVPGRSATAQIAGDLAPVCSVTELHLTAGVQPDQLTADEIQRVLSGPERR